MKASKGLLTSILAMTIATNCFADNVVNSEVKNSVELTTKSASTGQIGSSKDWNLNQSEWSKYIELKNGYQGYLFPNLSPPELLGYFAESDEERNHYAEIYARIEFENVEKELKFNKAFHEATIRLYGNLPIIKPFDVSPYNPVKIKGKENKIISTGDHLVLVVDILTSDYLNLVNHAISRINSINGAVVDIYCVNANSDAQIQEWAKKASIPFELVSKNQITLNSYEGRIKQLISSANLPVVYLVKNGRTEMIKMDDV